MWRRNKQHVEISRDANKNTNYNNQNVVLSVSKVIQTSDANYGPSYKDQLNSSTLETNPRGSTTTNESSKLTTQDDSVLFYDKETSQEQHVKSSRTTNTNAIRSDVQYKDQMRLQNVDFVEENCAGSIFNTTANKITNMHKTGVVQTQIKSCKSDLIDADLQYKDQIRQQMSSTPCERNQGTRKTVNYRSGNMTNTIIQKRIDVKTKSSLIDADLQYKDQIRQQMSETWNDSTIETNFTLHDDNNRSYDDKSISGLIDSDLQYKDQIRQQMSENLYKSNIQTNNTLHGGNKSYDNKSKSGLIDSDLQYKDQIRQQTSESLYEIQPGIKYKRYDNEANMGNTVSQQNNVNRISKIASTDPDVQYKNQIKGEIHSDMSESCDPTNNSNASSSRTKDMQIEYSKSLKNTLKASMGEDSKFSNVKSKHTFSATDSDQQYKDKILIHESMKQSSPDGADSPNKKIKDDFETLKSDTAQQEGRMRNPRHTNELLYKDQMQPQQLPEASDCEESSSDEFIAARRPSPIVPQRVVRPGAFRRYMNGNNHVNNREDFNETYPTITNIDNNDPSESTKFGDEDLNHLAVAVAVDEAGSLDGKHRAEAVEFDPDQKWGTHKKRIFRLWMMILSLVVVASIVAGIVTTRNRQNGMQPNPRLGLGIAEFVSSQISLFNFSANSTDALQKALDWIILDDPLQLIPSEHPNFMRRYSLAYLYYALSEKDWEYCSPHAPNLALRCRTKTEEGFNIHSFSWLLDMDECSWAGITCDTNRNHINGINLEEIGLTGEITANLDLIPFLHLLNLNMAGKVSGNLYHLNSTTCKHLKTFLISKNQLTGSLPLFILNWRSLINFHISKNKLTGVVNFQILNKDMKSLDISNNRFSKSAITDTNILRMRSLSSFSVRNNNFIGTIPQWLFELPYAYDIDIGGNQFMGTIPNVVNKNLVDIRMGQNHLTGTIPEAIYDLKEPTVLFINDNFLEGTISTKIGLLSTLIKFKVENNKELNGTIPTEIGMLSQLASLSLSGTNLTGSMPNELCRMRSLTLKALTADCMIIDDIAAEVDCSCCSSCCDADGIICTVT